MTENTSTHEPVGTASRIREWFNVRFRSATAIYGLIVFTAFITIASDNLTPDGKPIDAIELLEDAVPALIVFYAAHVFAHTLTDHAQYGFGRAFLHALRHSSGMLWSAIPTIVIIVIGVFTHMGVADVYWYAMLAAVTMLTLLGFLAYSRPGAHPIVRILGGIGTGLLGFVLIMLEYTLHLH